MKLQGGEKKCFAEDRKFVRDLGECTNIVFLQSLTVEIHFYHKRNITICFSTAFYWRNTFLKKKKYKIVFLFYSESPVSDLGSRSAKGLITSPPNQDLGDHFPRLSKLFIFFTFPQIHFKSKKVCGFCFSVLKKSMAVRDFGLFCKTFQKFLTFIFVNTLHNSFRDREW